MNTPLQRLFVMFAGWVNELQRAVIAYLQEENRVLREVQGRRRLRFNDDQRRRLAAKGRALGRRLQRDLDSVVTPDTILRWHRELIARNYDGSEARVPGRPAIDELWMSQVGRNLIDEASGFLRGKGFFIHDRDPLHTRDFRALLTKAGVKPVRLPPRSPNPYAYAECFVLSIKSDCLDRMVLLGEGHLWRAIVSYGEHYHLERSPQGLGNRLIESDRLRPVAGPIARQERLGGLLNHYYREAA